MCGFFSSPKPDDFQQWHTYAPKGYTQTYNARVGTMQAVILTRSPLHAELMKWSLVPHWSKTPTVKFATFNARAETVETSPVFRDSFKKRRCLVPVTGFYENEKIDGVSTKKPYYFHIKDRNVFGLAGLWDEWKDAEGKAFHSFTIITTEPNDVVGSVHNRMPVIISKEDESVWLDSDTPREKIKQLLHPFPSTEMEGYRVKDSVSSGKSDDPENIEPIDNIS